ncbi:diguanylate cyclase [Rhodospirillaceae bacterium KN72]|uniref:diguanylate cyclase n=1 Tax=Pacificispira spongiicola TaxID=2729598 RepID=A0A7Y0HEJ5_9PROT|nr:diguanylate cyclase [Pacificispira spongiicola]NMM44765.1 diguanylate cyclase [Pacificispira spongiicola]
MKALILEDNETMGSLVKRCAESIPEIEADLCTTYSEFQQKLEAPDIDLILLDHYLPDGEGVEILRALRNNPRFDNAPIFLVTAETDRQFRLQALQAGATEFLEKPFDVVELTARLKNIAAMIKATRELRQEIGRLQEMATTDALTGILNRRAYLDRLELEVQRATRFKHPLSVAMLDVDHFKSVNDTYGHSTGDRVLVKITEVVRNRLRGIDVFGRLGGEEFSITMAETNLRGARVLAERIREDIEALRLDDPDFARFRVTASIGVAEWKSGLDPAQCLDRADRVLYRAKQSGRNRVEFWDIAEGVSS